MLLQSVLDPEVLKKKLLHVQNPFMHVELLPQTLDSDMQAKSVYYTQIKYKDLQYITSSYLLPVH